MSIKNEIYENKNYNISEIEQSNDLKIPTLVQTAYYENMILMPKCKCYISFGKSDISSIMQVINTTKYVAITRGHYRSKRLKKGCIGRIIDHVIDHETGIIKVHIEGIRRFSSFQIEELPNYPYEIIKPNYILYKEDLDIQQIDPQNLDPIFLQFFMQFINNLDINEMIDFSLISLNKLLNSLIMIMPITDAERVYLSELSSLNSIEKALSLILNCTFNNLTSDYDFH